MSDDVIYKSFMQLDDTSSGTKSPSDTTKDPVVPTTSTPVDNTTNSSTSTTTSHDAEQFASQFSFAINSSSDDPMLPVAEPSTLVEDPQTKSTLYIPPKEPIEFVLEEDELLISSAEDTMKKLMIASEIILSKIKTYVDNEKISFTLTRPTYGLQYFEWEGCYYILDDDQCKHIYDKFLCDLTNVACFENYIKKQPNILQQISRKIVTDEIFKDLKAKILCDIPHATLAKITTICLSDILIKDVIETKNIRKQLFFNSTAQSIGTAILEHYVIHCLNTYTPQSSEATSDNYVIASEEGVENLTIPFQKNIPEEDLLLKDLDKLYHLFKTNDYKKDDFYRMFKITFTKHDDPEVLALTNFFMATVINKKLVEVKNPLEELYITFAEHYKKYTLKLGSDILYALIQAEIFTAGVTTDYRTKVPRQHLPTITLNETQHQQALAGCTFFKPPLTEVRPDPVVDISVVPLHLTLRLKNQIVNGNPHFTHTHIYPSSKLITSVETASQLKMTLDLSFVESFMDLTKSIISIPFDPSNPSIQLFLYTVYEIDFKQILENNTDKLLISDLMLFGISFMVTRVPANLMKRCEGNVSAKDIYNKIYSMKYFLLGLYNELNIYKHFGYFFIPKFCSSTGRLFSYPFFLNLQSFKICKSFIQNYTSQDYLLTEEQYNNVSAIFNKVLPTIGQVLTLDYKTYDQKTRSNYILYLSHFLMDSTNIFENVTKSYPFRSDLLTQLVYLRPFVKKSENLLYVACLLNNSNRPWHFNFQKDATSSGLQHISLVLQDHNIALHSNLLGNVHNDIYKMFSNKFSLDFDFILDFCNKFCIKIFGQTFKEWCKSLPKQLPTLDEMKKSRDIKLWLMYIFTCQEKLYVSTLMKDFSHVFGLRNISETDPSYPILVLLHSELLQARCGWLLTESTTFAKSKLLENSLYTRLAQWRHFFKFSLASSHIPKETLDSRNLFKKSVMTFAYHAGDNSRVEDFQQYFKDYYSEKGYNKVPDVLRLCRYLNQFFLEQMKITLPTCREFLQHCDDYIRKSLNASNAFRPIRMEFPFLTWEFLIPQEAPVSRVIVGGSHIGNLDKHKLSIKQYKKEYDQSQMQCTFSSIFIHSMDAHIVHLGYNITQELNQLLRQNNLPLFHFYANHDCFGVNLLYSIYLQPMIAHFYNLTSQHNFGKLINIKNNSSVPPILVENPHFIKH